MREIKFKGYSKINNTWYYGLLGKFDGKYYIECEGGTKPFVEEDSIGQYTGFKDKNGVEIYEGDIVEYETHDDIDNYISQVKVYFDDEMGTWMGYDEVEGGYTELYSIHNKCKIIGNIYKEKLKESK